MRVRLTPTMHPSEAATGATALPRDHEHGPLRCYVNGIPIYSWSPSLAVTIPADVVSALERKKTATRRGVAA